MNFLLADLKHPATQVARSFIILLVVASVIIQAIGVFLYPLYPDRSTSAERTWDCEHSIIIESYQYGFPELDSITTYSFPPLPPLLHLQLKAPVAVTPQPGSSPAVQDNTS